MAGIKDSFSKGLATLNVKTSNFMEENKFKTGIATKEAEIAKLMAKIGEVLYENRENFSIELVQEDIDGITSRYEDIEEFKRQIEELAQVEKGILGEAPKPATAAAPEDNTPKVFCAECGAPNPANFKFCTKCGSQL